MSKVWYVIPARRNSKGLKFKNRKLLEYTLSTIPPVLKKQVIVTTDDEKILDECLKQDISCISRKSHLAADDTDIKSVMKDVMKTKSIPDEDIIVMLYLTYPERSWHHIHDTLNFFVRNNSSSLLCAKEVKSHPYLCIYEENGQQIVKHNLYRRQDYPKCLEISHYVCIFFVGEIKKLNKNMYNKDTTYYRIDQVIDVDHKKDFDSFIERKKYDKDNSRNWDQP